jgi:palmitoyl-[glycerolipid] 3-(E)-desaturase
MCYPETTKANDANATPSHTSLSIREQKIAKLNDRVSTITQQAIINAAAGPQTKPLAPEFVYAQRPMTTLTAGWPIYQVRCAPLVHVYSICAAVLIMLSASQLHPLISLGCALIAFVGYDAYSGILHVVFDHPDNIRLPIIGQPCLEFQWHHSIPDDLVRKDFVDVCGDLNMAIGMVICVNLAILRPSFQVGVPHLLGGLKLAMAYYGQFSHRSAHSVGTRLSPIAKALQRVGGMVSPRAHRAHHVPPLFDQDYCLLGVANPLIDGMLHVTHNRVAWLILFFAWSVLDIHVYTLVVEGVARMYSLL